jgi:hypothetical protein
MGKKVSKTTLKFWTRVTRSENASVKCKFVVKMGFYQDKPFTFIQAEFVVS